MNVLFGIQVIVSDALPITPDHRTNARSLVRRGLYDAFPWLQGDPGPNPGDLTHALLIGGQLLTSADYANRLNSQTPSGGSETTGTTTGQSDREAATVPPEGPGGAS